MDLFKVEGEAVKPTEHALMIPPYSEIWERDTDPKKGRAMMDLAYIEFSCSYKKSNPFKGYPEEIRQERIIEAVYRGEEFEQDDLIKEGMELYEKFRKEASPTLQYYLAAKAGAEKMMDWLNTFDMNKTNPRNGMPLYKPREITSALSDSYNVMKTLNSLEEKVYEQIFETTKTKANKEINHFER